MPKNEHKRHTIINRHIWNLFIISDEMKVYLKLSYDTHEYILSNKVVLSVYRS
jgi:hypothetical protein